MRQLGHGGSGPGRIRRHPRAGLNVGGGAMDGHLLQDNRQDAFEAIATRELQLSRIEMANLMYRLTSMEKVREQLLGILINQQTTMLNGAPVPTAATHNPATTSTGYLAPGVGLSAHGRRGDDGGGRRHARVDRAERDQHQRWYFARDAAAPESAATAATAPESAATAATAATAVAAVAAAAAARFGRYHHEGEQRVEPNRRRSPPSRSRRRPRRSSPTTRPLRRRGGGEHLRSVESARGRQSPPWPRVGLGGHGTRPGRRGGGGAGLAGGGGSLANGAGLNLGGLGAGLAAQPGLLYPRQPEKRSRRPRPFLNVCSVYID